jgi:hypothetical protein
MTFDKTSPSGKITVQWEEAWGGFFEISNGEVDRGLIGIDNTELSWLIVTLSGLRLLQEALLDAKQVSKPPLGDVR